MFQIKHVSGMRKKVYHGRERKCFREEMINVSEIRQKKYLREQIKSVSGRRLKKVAGRE